MAEKQSDHRQEMERLALTSNVKRSQQGLWAGFAIGVVGIAASAVVTCLGFPWVGATIGVADIGALVGVFVYGSQGQRQERSEKDKQRQQAAGGQSAEPTKS